MPLSLKYFLYANYISPFSFQFKNFYTWDFSSDGILADDCNARVAALPKRVFVYTKFQFFNAVANWSNNSGIPLTVWYFAKGKVPRAIDFITLNIIVRLKFYIVCLLILLATCSSNTSCLRNTLKTVSSDPTKAFHLCATSSYACRNVAT